MEDKLKLTEITMEILENLDNYIKYINNDMIIEDIKIIKGIILVKNIIINLNPDKLNLNMINLIEIKIDEYIQNREKQGISTSKYIQYGINMSKNIILSLCKKNKNIVKKLGELK